LGIMIHTVDGCEILHQLIGGKHPILQRVSTIQDGAGFLPSTIQGGAPSVIS
jgi:hypothetical protein